MTTIVDAVREYLGTIRLSRSENTYLSYKTALVNLLFTLESHKIDTLEVDTSILSEDLISWFAHDLKGYAPSTEQLYIQAAKGFAEFLVGEDLCDLNLSKVQLLIRQRTRKPGIRLPQFPADDIEKILVFMNDLEISKGDFERDYLRALRDRAFLITLGDTGLRVHEACNLKRGDIDWNEGKALIVGKGNHQAIVRFSRRSQRALRKYTRERGGLDGKSGKPLGALPLFSRHDKGAGNSVKQITPTTGRNIVDFWVEKILGHESVGTITPHSFRHYFVTRVLSRTGNLKLAQSLARHKNIAVTQRYAHLSNDELDKGYWEVFEEE